MGLNNIYHTFLMLFLVLLVAKGFSKSPLILKEKEKIYHIDSTHFVQLDSIAINKFIESATSSNSRLYFYNADVEKSYWYRFSLSNNDSIDKEWLLVSYNYSIDEIDLIIYSNSGSHEKQFFRDTMGISSRKVRHKQPVFTIGFKPHETKTFIVRIKNESPYQYVFAVYSTSEFFSHFFQEYLLFGLFYGLMLFVFLYSIMYYIFLNDKVVLIYAFFIASQIFYMLFRDGNGLFLMPDYTEHADVVKNICLAGLSVFILLYTTYFLKVDTKSLLFKTFMLFIVLRIIYAFFTLEHSTLFSFHIELVLILFCTYHSVRFYFNGYPDAKYMSIGLSLLSFSYIVYYLTLVGVTSLSFGFFVLYYGIAAESIFMTMALTERFKRIRLDSFRQEQMNKELEGLVASRTELLEEQSQELNLFLYSASHDLKGPLKTIKGLCNIGLIDQEADHHRNYHLIISRLKRLESNINDLNAVTNIKNDQKALKEIDFKELHQEMIETFQGSPRYKDIEVALTVDEEVRYKADVFAIRCIYQNIFENAIKYKDVLRKSFLKIHIMKLGDSVKMEFEDNGQGISTERLPFIFNMFYRANEDSKEDTGLGLYIVKLAVKKLGGEISVISSPGVGTSFFVVLPMKGEGKTKPVV